MKIFTVRHVKKILGTFFVVLAVNLLPFGVLSLPASASGISKSAAAQQLLNDVLPFSQADQQFANGSLSTVKIERVFAKFQKELKSQAWPVSVQPAVKVLIRALNPYVHLTTDSPSIIATLAKNNEQKLKDAVQGLVTKLGLN